MEAEHSLLDLETVFTVGRPPKGREADPHALERTGHVVFEYQDGCYPYHYEVRAFGSIFAGGVGAEPAYVGYLHRDEAWMLGMIHDCLGEWEQYIAKYYDVPGGGTFAPDREHIEAAVPHLAEAGDRLFSAVFLQGDDGLRKIGQLLAEATQTGEQVITFYSDRIFIPWWIMYSDPGTVGIHKTADWSPEGFWGYRHLLEHEFIHNTKCPDHRIPVAGVPLQVSLNLDLSLDSRSGAPVTESVRAFFAEREEACAHVVRTTRDELGAALSSPEFGDQIMYFCCHCGSQQGFYGGPSRSVLQLTDAETITPAHLSGWLRERDLISNPFIFINACGGGLLSTQFYCSFGHELIRKAANCVVGPEVRVPGRFAAVYAVELLTRFLEPHRRLGAAMRDVTRYLIDCRFTPLGLIYGLYRGLDTRLVAGGLD